MRGLEGRTILVTGAAGCVGTAVVRSLAAEGARVRAMVRRPIPAPTPDVDVVVADLTDAAALRDAAEHVELVVHCAAALSADETICRETNIEGTRNLIDTLLVVRCRRIVHLSSVSVYDGRLGLDFDEHSAVWSDASSPYGYSKVESERIVRAATARGLEGVILRPAMVLSMHPTSFWGPRALERARGAQSPIFSCADLPFVHVDNLARAIVLALRTKSAAGRVYDVIDGYGATAEYLDAVATAIGRPAPPLAPNAPRMRFRGERIRLELGYDPPDRFAEFVEELRVWHA